MHYFLLILFQENRHHVVSVGKSLSPVLIIEILLYVLLNHSLVLFDNELLEGVVQYPLKDPFLQDLEVGLRALL